MDPAPESLPDDVAALKAALIAERARRLEVAAELVVAQAKASEDMALIAAQKLQIAKLQRQIYGQRSERSARLIDQLALEFEELAATATEDELAAEQAAAKTEMAALEEIDALSQDYLDKLEHIRAAVAHHVYEEESKWFLELKEKVPQLEQSKLTARYTEEFNRYLGREVAA